MTLSEKSAYLKGLMDGLKLDTDKNEGKLIAAIIDMLSDVAENVADLEDVVDCISDELDCIEEDLDNIDDYLMDDDDDEYDDEYDEDDDYYEDTAYWYDGASHSMVKDDEALEAQTDAVIDCISHMSRDELQQALLQLLINLCVKHFPENFTSICRFCQEKFLEIPLRDHGNLRKLSRIKTNDFLNLLVCLSLLPLIFPSVRKKETHLRCLFHIPEASICFSSLPYPEIFRITAHGIFLSPIRKHIFNISVCVF